TIQMNHRKLMRGFFEGLGISEGEQQMLVLREVDKLDKRGADYVRGTLTGEAFGLSAEVAQKILDFVEVRSTSLADALDKLDALGSGSETFEQGRAELKEVLQLIKALGVPESAFALNLSIARGLDYYTGMVYETTLDEHPEIGSICSGGRYDNLASQYTKSKLPGVGISIGVTRLYWQLREAGLMAAAGGSTVQAMVALMDDEHLPACLALAGELRAAGMATEVALEGGKLGKQFKYADRAGIRFVLVQGESELANGTVTVKDMRRNAQFEVARDELAKTLRVEWEQEIAMAGDNA
ncbi:MAG TPA: HisS family protein, partial [Rhodanobacteraceae bacterium]|nr:HisS family protein [Rhodanobacteraceae bacterium]